MKINSEYIKSVLIFFLFAALGLLISQCGRMMAPTPVPQGLHRQTSVADVDNCKDEVKRAIQEWADRVGLAISGNEKDDSLSLFLVTDEDVFIEIFFDHNTSDVSSALSLGLIPRRTVHMDHQLNQYHWNEFQMNELWGSLMSEVRCRPHEQ